MTRARRSPRGWQALALVAPAMLAGQALWATPAFAQDPEGTTQELRLRQLEASVRALQQQVFPAGGAAAPGVAPGQPVTSTPMTDMLTRMDAVETQVARLTSEYEEMNNHMRQIDARLAAAGTPQATTSEPTQSYTPPAQSYAPAPAYTPPPAPRAAAPAGPSASRLAAVKAVVKPQTDDPGEDEYSYGFKLWEAKFYPEAEQQLEMYLDKYPRHRRVSYARNLIGRSLLDEGKPRDAAEWFLKNYQNDKQGDRASDSLLYLAQAMVQIKDTNRACIALSEFARTYASDAAGRLRDQYDRTRSSAGCS